MQVINLGEGNTVLNKFISEMRDKKVQKDPVRFRLNLERVGEIFAYEISKTLDYAPEDIVTPLGIANMQLPASKVVVATILRAGLPLHGGLLRFFDGAQNAFIAAYRKYDKGGNFKIAIEYATAPELDGKVLILADTMLATGASLEIALNKILEKGDPKHIHLVCPMCSKYAVEYLKKQFHGMPVTLWCAAIDEELTSHSYIVPGLGDAGDLAYGEKL